MDECGAGENFTGCKLITIPTKDGKMNPKQIKPLLHSIGNEHHSQPKVISITQSTELGTVYSIAEIKNLAKFAHKNNMFLHIDGARISNAVATLNTDFKRMITDTDIDVLSFGGTKNGMMFGEAVIFFNKKLSKDFKYIRKQGMQLSSKMRFISAQFLALLSNDLWLKNAQHSNKMAKLLEKELKKIPRIKITQQVQANAVFALIPKKYIPILQKEYFFYVWDEETSEVRLMCSFDTTKNDIKDFIKTVRKIVK
jgi:threonine aldolase